MMVNSNPDNHDNNQQAKSTLHQPTKRFATVGEQLKLHQQQQQAEESQFQANLQSQPNPNKEKVTIWNFITYPDLSYADHFRSEQVNDNRFNAHHHPKSPNFTTKNVKHQMENQCHDHGRKLENQVPRTDDDFINQTKRQPRQQSPQGAYNLASVKIAPKEEMLLPQQKSCLFDNVNQQPQQKEQNAQPKADEKESRKIEQMQREYENEEYEDKLETDRLREKQQTLPQGNNKQSHPQSTSFIINLWPNAFSSSHHIHHQSSKLPEIVKHFTLKLKTFSFFQNKATEKQNKKTTNNKDKKKINKKSNHCQTVKFDPENSILIDQVQQDRRETDRLESIMQRASLYAAFVIVCFLIVLVVNKIHAQYGTDSKRLLLQQQIVQPVGRLDLSKYEHLNQRREQIKNPPLERLEETLTKGKLKTDSNKRLLIAGAGDGGNGGGTSNPIVEKFRYGIDSRITTSSMVNSAVRKQEKHDNSLREIEWDSSDGSTSSTEAPNKQRKQNLYYAPQQKKQPNRGEPEQVPKNSAPYLLGDDCSSCVKQNYLAHYLEKGCKPVYRTECDCAKYFRCPRKPPQAVLSSQDSLKIAEREEKPCVYDNKVYDFGEQIPMPDEPCRLCRCRKRRFYNGTLTKTYGEVDCSLFVECPEMVFGVKPKRASCHFAYRHDQCCGKEICVDELPPEDVQVRTTCRYRSKTYRYGQIIYPEENSCTKCICDETWNEHNPLASGGCQKRKCTAFLQENILHKCTPVYRIDGCCPIEFICPEKRKLYDPELEEEQDSLPFDIELPQNGEKCILNGTSYSVGDKLYVDRKDTQHGRTCARCECQVPPMLTCKADFKCSGL